MKKRMTWRFSCDFCGKASCSGGHIARHERHCTKNPNRVCRMCARVGEQQPAISALMDSVEWGPMAGFDDVDELRIGKLRAVSHNCPACILAALRQVTTPDGDVGTGGDFKFNEERLAWLEDYRASLMPVGYEGDTEFDRDEWLARRTKRFASPEVRP